MKPVLNERKCPALATCPAISACPEGAIRHVADKTTRLGGRIVFEYTICTDCGDCVTACCGNAIALAEKKLTAEENPTEGESNMLTIKVLGPGCANCHKMEELVKTAMKELGIEAKIEKITDIGQIAIPALGESGPFQPPYYFRAPSRWGRLSRRNRCRKRNPETPLLGARRGGA